MRMNDFIKGKDVLFIPIYSMRDYATGVYKLDSDGNMARIVSKLIECDYNFATVYIPSCNSGLAKIINQLNRAGKYDKVRFKVTDGYGKNAKETRDFPDGLLKKVIWESDNCVEYDVIIAEPNYLIDKLVDYTDEVIYWNVASDTTFGTPWFVKEYSELDKKLAKDFKTACANKAQVDKLGGQSFVEKFYDPSYFDYKIIFFPFRISDASYKARTFYEVIRDIYFEEGITNFKVYYSDPNSSNDIFRESDIFVKVPSNHDIYIGILKGKPIIPYLEDHDMIEHISINEFKYYNCNVIMRAPRNGIYLSNFEFMNSYDELKTALIKKLGEKND